MKLFTEEQVYLMLFHAKDIYEDYMTYEDVLKTQTPIEIPNDEEEILIPFPSSDNSLILRDGAEIKVWQNGWEIGFNSIREQILNQTK